MIRHKPSCLPAARRFDPAPRRSRAAAPLSLALWALPLCLPLPQALAADRPAPPLMLAQAWPGEVELAAYWVSEKLDGVRAYWDGRQLLTRAGNLIHAPAWFTAGWPAQPLDGELWLGRGRFDELSGIVRRQQPQDGPWRQVLYMVFDLPAEPGPFERRLARLNRLVQAQEAAWLRAVPQFRLDDAAALDRRLARVVAAGGEGLMLHRADAPYRAWRSDDLLKLKRHDDAEARVIAHEPGQGRLTGLMGALLVERPDGLRFRLGTGFTDAQRRNPPPPGSWVTYRYNGLTGDGVPRFARFLRRRHELPPPDGGPAPARHSARSQ